MFAYKTAITDSEKNLRFFRIGGCSFTGGEEMVNQMLSFQEITRIVSENSVRAEEMAAPL
jgi:hypothetical protein